MKSASPKFSSAPAKLSPVTPDGGEGSDKRARILDAALGLFLRYGVKRTSIDDVAREAGIAKGTVYLYYESKTVLFAAIAGRLCADVLAAARRVLQEKAQLTEKLVDFLDAYVGKMHRVAAQSPHVEELTLTKESVAAATYAEFNLEMKAMLRSVLNDAGVVHRGAPEMFLAAALGALRTGDIAEKAYRARLTTLVDTLVVGLRHSVSK
jgi:AcrR family transcriptional regulator